jgi:small-conductance mechanosensitive channel
MMTQEIHPIVDLTDEALQQMLQRALRNTLILGTFASIAVLVGSGWRNGAMLLTGMLISAASILEWRHLVRVINARLDKQRTPTSATAVVLFFVLRLTIFAGVIYGSLKCFQGSVVALLCGLGLAALAVGWEVIRLLRD